MDDLEIRQGGHAPGAPGDEAFTSVDQALVIESLEDFADGTGWTGVHGKGEAGPIAGGSQNLHLLADAPAVLIHIGPDTLDKGLAAEIVSGHPLARELLFHHPLPGDTSV